MNYNLKNIAVITGTRAEFGILRPLIQDIESNEHLRLQLLVTAMHLSPEFGYTVEEIEKSGVRVDKKIECLLSSDTAVGVSKSVALALIGFAEAFAEMEPDLIFILGDRSEMLAAATAATLSNIPIAHIHGGETTEGAYDESIRHAITKMSYWHFASTEGYRQRIIQLGEDPVRVFNVGAMGLDSIKKLNLCSKEELEEELAFKFGNKSILITYHPVTLENKSAESQFLSILQALDSYDDLNLIFTHSNSDKEGRVINRMIEEYVTRNSHKAVAFKSLGQKRYFSCLKYVDAVLGNSSSGIIEVPYFNIPTINVGDRQKGRLAPLSVIHVEPKSESIMNALKRALSKDFTSEISGQKQLYGTGNTSECIMKIMVNSPIETLKKPFYDLNFNT